VRIDLGSPLRSHAVLHSPWLVHVLMLMLMLMLMLRLVRLVRMVLRPRVLAS
jgi:hypothetical protein